MLKNRLLPLLACCLGLLIPTADAVTFKLSSIGYHPQGAKMAIIEDIPEGQDLKKIILFDPTRRNPKIPLLLGATVFKFDKMQSFQESGQAGPAVKSLLLDFSDFKQAGTYEIRIEDTDIKSPPIKISEFLYWDTLKPVVKAFYFQRCGQEVEDRNLKLFHAACHLKDGAFASPDWQPQRLVLDEEEGIDATGGWHNGSDYAKYVTSTALSAARLMAMYELNPKPFKYFRLDYPMFEPGYGTTADLHHEIKAGLDWLMTMQRRDGAFYRKVAGKQWPGKVGPDGDEQPRYVYGVSTADTANAAAALAMAARNFKREDLGYGVKSLLAAEKAWQFLASHPDAIWEKSDSDYAGSGEFLDPNAKNDKPYRLFAAAELYISTGKDAYHQAFLNYLKEVPLQRFSWQNPAMQGIVDYLLYAPKKHDPIADLLKKHIRTLADEVATSVETGLYPSGLKRYALSSNQDVTERAALLLAACQLSGETRYREAASRSISYLFGLNPFGITYISGLEGKSVAHPAYRWTETTGKLVPGLVVDGPNEFATDGKTPKGQGILSYADAPGATGSNEPRIMNNASLAYLLGALNAAYNVGQETESPSADLPAQPKK